MALAPRTLASPESPLAQSSGGSEDRGRTAPATREASGERETGAASYHGWGLARTFQGGEVVAARWRIERLLGVGGMGEVYEAFDQDLGQHVALKTLRSDRDGVPRAVLGLKREVHLSRRVTHSAACRVFDFGVHEDGDRTVAFLVMELLDGEPLSAHLGRHGPLAPATLRELALDLADALAAAHRVQVVHRDLKPGNVMLVRDERGEGRRRAVVMDFGIARLAQEIAHGHDGAFEPGAASTFAGTPLYMAPEQLRGERATAASDVYAYGLVLLEAATAEAPEGAASLPRLLQSREVGHRRESFVALPSWLVPVVRRCLAKEPAERFADGSAVGEALRAALPERVRERRRFRWLTATGSVVVLGAAVYGLLAQRARSGAENDASAARHFGEEVAQVEAVVRHSAMMPLHDVRGERAQVRKHLTAIEGALSSLRPVPAAAARLALVRGGIALGDIPFARRHADAAWNAGDRSAELRFARGRVMATQYRQERAALSVLAEPTYRKRRLAELDAELRTPALELLKSAQRDGDEPELAAALVAAYEGRRDDAKVAAEAVLAKAPWMVEAARLEGEMLVAEAEDARAREDATTALALLERAAGPFERAMRLAESDGATRLGECDRATLAQEVKIDLSRYTSAGREDALDACERALRVDPDAVPSLLATVRALLLGPWDETRMARSERAVVLGDHAVVLANDDARAYAALSDAHALRAFFAHKDGNDPRPEDDLAEGAFEEALRRAPDAILRSLRAEGSSARAEFETQQGLDPRPATRRLLAAAESGLEVLPDAYALHDLAARLHRDIALYDGAHEDVPIPSYERSLVHFDWMAKEAPSLPTGALNVCFTANHLASFLVKIGEDPTGTVARATEGCRLAAAGGDANSAHTVHADAMLALYRAETTAGRDGKAALTEAKTQIDLAILALATDGANDYGDTLRKTIAVDVGFVEAMPFAEARTAYLHALDVLEHGLPPTHEKSPALPEHSLLERAWVERLAQEGRPLDAAVTKALTVADRALAERPYSPRVRFSQGRIWLALAERTPKGPLRTKRAEEALRYFALSVSKDKHGGRQVEPFAARANALLRTPG